MTVFSVSVTIINGLLTTIGLWLLFPKCGVKRIWALVPFVRYYKLAQCADRSDDGIVYCMVVSGYELLSEIYSFMGSAEEASSTYLLLILMLILSVISLVYSIRIYQGLCKVFERKKAWVILWIFFSGIVSVVWGAGKNYVPAYKVGERKKKAAALSGITADSLEEGLSINLRSRYVVSMLRRRDLLKDVHLNINPGRMVLLLGGSGAGKTTFVNAITGYEKADATILLNGEDVYKNFDDLKYEIGFVPQQDLIRYNDTVIRTLQDAAALRLPTNLTREERKQRIQEALDMFGLAPVKDNIVAKQSGGQKKRISIATEFIADPSLFILDEPDSGLDGILARELMNWLHRISRQGKIVIVITHTPDRVIDLFDDVIVLGKDENHCGRLVYYGPVDEARKFFGTETMEDIVRVINRKEEGGLGRADELIEKYAEVCHGKV